MSRPAYRVLDHWDIRLEKFHNIIGRDGSWFSFRLKDLSKNPLVGILMVISGKKRKITLRFLLIKETVTYIVGKCENTDEERGEHFNGP